MDFLSEVQNFDWFHLIGADCIDKVSELNTMLLECFDRHAPLIRVQAKNLPAPWITVELREAKRERDSARHLWRRKRDDASYNNFRILHNEVQNRVHAAKSIYYMDIFN